MGSEPRLSPVLERLYKNLQNYAVQCEVSVGHVRNFLVGLLLPGFTIFTFPPPLPLFPPPIEDHTQTSLCWKNVWGIVLVKFS